MSIRSDFFDAKTKGAKWDVGVSIARTNPLPLDVNEVFDTKANLDAYVAGVLSYPGQLVALVGETETTIYYIDQDKALQEVGKKPIGDDLSVSVDADTGKISLKNYGKEYYAFDSETKTWASTPTTGWKAGLQPRIVSAGSGADTHFELAWFEPSTTTVDDLAEQLNQKADKADLASVYKYKGSVETVADLPASNNVEGDVYNVAKAGTIGSGDTAVKVKAGDNVAWVQPKNATGYWDVLSGIENLSDYSTTEEIKTNIVGFSDKTVKAYVDDKATELTTSLTDSLQGYTDEQITALGISDYAKTETVTGLISTAKSGAITEAGTAADTKISAKVGDLGKNADETDKTVKQYVDEKDTALSGEIDNAKGLVVTLEGKLKALAYKDKVADTDLTDDLKSTIDGKADKAKTLAGYGITDAYTTTETDAKIDEKITAAAYDDTTIKKSIKDNTDAISAINDEATGILAQAKTDAAAKVKALEDGQVATNKADIAKLNGDEKTEGSVKQIAKAAADAAVSVITKDAPEAFDTLKEIADWISNDETGAASISKQVGVLVGSVEGDKTKSAREIAAEEVAKVPAATMEALGLVKGTANKVTVANGEITGISTDILTQGADTLILNGGTAAN